MRALIIGAGEVGTSLGRALEVVHKVCIIDKDVDESLKQELIEGGVDVLNVCYPYFEGFVEATKAYIETYKPGITIIHSTVPVGTTRLLEAVHSPIHGKHPNLEGGILTFAKYVGAEDAAKAKFAHRFLREAGISAHIVDTPETSELSKLCCTTYLGVIVAYMYYVKELCDRHRADFEMVYGWNDFYNIGYKRLGMPQFVRPRLEAPKEWSGCGGHCVQENSILLRKNENDPYTDLLTSFVLSAGKASESIAEEKPYLNLTWLWCEHWGKGKSIKEIAESNGITSSDVSQIMKRRNVPIRSRHWTDSEIAFLKEASETKTFKEISELLGKTHDAVRSKAIQLSIESCYEPGEETQKEDIRKKISATLQGVTPEEWSEFIESTNALIRKSEDYKDWRSAVFSRDEYKCKECGAVGLIEAHHIKSFAKFPDERFNVDNGETLCKDCHKERHYAQTPKND